MILILGAVEEEVRPFLDLGLPSETVQVHSVGVGSVAAGINTSRIIAECHDKLPLRPEVLFVGSVGAYDQDTAALSLIVGTRAVLYDTASAAGKGFIPDRTLTAISADGELAASLANHLPDGVLAGGVCSPLSITTCTELAGKIADAADCEYENLELFGVGLASELMHVPWGFASSVTNTAGPHAHEQWLQYREVAAENTARAVHQWLAKGA